MLALRLGRQIAPRPPPPPRYPPEPEEQGLYPPTATGSQLAARMGPGMVITNGGGWIVTSEGGIWLMHPTLAPGRMPRLLAEAAPPPP